MQQLVIPKVGNRTVRSRLYAIVNEAYFGSFTREYNAGVVRDLVWLEAPHCIPSSGHDLPYKALMDEVRKRGLLRKIMEAGAEELALVRDDTLWMQALDASLARSPHRNGGGRVRSRWRAGGRPCQGRRRW